jgi:hypothetical protein
MNYNMTNQRHAIDSLTDKARSLPTSYGGEEKKGKKTKKKNHKKITKKMIKME